ncbi:DUF998 domain-containing protein [Spirosoma panaciterrae]|uniref:DUF998 domain-containing protein n=1 Tax=Spirosoma panaciterrae TaxID=496058 RepID=UPI00037056DD|nr:DUF998 domain-containing protein [Spirosoma panaciterrae]
MAIDLRQRSVFLMSGMVAVGLYGLHIVLGGMLWPGYDHLQQPISDLTANDAPNRDLLMVFTTMYSVLALLFALTVATTEGSRHGRLVFWASVTFVLLHLISLLYGFFPEDLPNSAPTFRGVLHIVITALIVPCTIATPLLLGYGLRTDPVWRPFARYSILTGFLILLFGSLTAFFYVNKLAYFGLVERLNIGVLQVWTFFLSLKLTRRYDPV